MAPKNYFLIIVALIISTSSAAPLPSGNQSTEREHATSFAPVPKKDNPVDAGKLTKNIVTVEAQERQDYPPGQAPVIGPMMNAMFGGKRPIEAISGPYYSSSIGPAFSSGPFSGLGIPLSPGPLGGVMGIPLLFLTRNG